MSKKKFDEEKQKKALEWIDQKWPQTKRECEICGSKKWSISTDFTTPVVFDGGLQIGGASYPTVSLICENCGNTKYFNAVKMGLLEGNSEGVNE